MAEEKRRKAPMKVCPGCETSVHARVAKCPKCGVVFPKKRKRGKDERLLPIVESPVSANRTFLARVLQEQSELQGKLAALEALLERYGKAE